MTDLATALIQHFESCRLQSYLDTEQVPTIGWGHTGPEVYYPGMTCTQEEADAWLEQDKADAERDASEFPHFATLGDVRQAVLVSMCYQMGTKPLRWPDFMAALQAQDYPDAAEAGLDSLWARQTPERAKIEMKMLSDAQWIGDYG